MPLLGPTPRPPVAASDPFADQKRALLAQLSADSPSVAEQQFREANARAIQNQAALARGRGPGAVRQAGIQGGQLAQGLQAGASQARAQEMLGRQGLHAQTLQGFSGQELDRERLNFGARMAEFQKILAEPGAFDRLMQMASVAGTVSGIGTGQPKA